jgi:hypothetical protein
MLCSLPARQTAQGGRSGGQGGQPRGKVVPANTSEIEKGRAAIRKGAHRTVKEKTEIGRQLLAKKAELPWGHFGPWLLEQSGLSQHMAHQCMRLARQVRSQPIKGIVAPATST